MAPFTASHEETRVAIAAVVEGQLAAIRRGDMAAAYRFAAAGIRRQFTEAQFGAMVRQGYQAIARHRHATVGAVFDDSARAVASVVITGADRTRRHFTYVLLREEGGWRIGGVQETPAPSDRPAA
jgi:acyl CoA:acetate/3-ketoacid CoA transferase alpha subunit